MLPQIKKYGGKKIESGRFKFLFLTKQKLTEGLSQFLQTFSADEACNRYVIIEEAMFIVEGLRPANLRLIGQA